MIAFPLCHVLLALVMGSLGAGVGAVGLLLYQGRQRRKLLLLSALMIVAAVGGGWAWWDAIGSRITP